MTPEIFNLAGRLIGPGRPCFIIAEAGVNHNGDLDLARRMIDAAASAGADAVKFQTFSAERIASPNAPKAEYQKRSGGGEQSQFEMLKALELTPDDHRALMDHCRGAGVIFLSSPFDEQSADLLAELGVAGYKIPSGELTNWPYLAHVAAKGKPMIVSTGMADLNEVAAALAVIEAAGDPPLALLHCVSAYPADPAGVNLRAMLALEGEFGRPVGFSDHTQGLAVALAAAALGATVIEKHFTLDRSLPGPDQTASIEPDQLAELVAGVRTVESALGDGRKRPTPEEENTAAVARKSLFAARDLAAGEVIGPADLISLRPGTGISPARRDEIIGRRVKADIAAGTMLAWEMLA